MVIGGVFDEGDYDYDKVVLLETNIDDMNPEYYEVVIEKLYLSGALDVYITPIIMKKSRPANKITVISKSKDKHKLIDILLKETSSLGIRESYVNRATLKRETLSIDTDYGKVKIKVAFIDEKVIKVKPEYEDVKKISLVHNIPIYKVEKYLVKEFENHYNKRNIRKFL